MNLTAINVITKPGVAYLFGDGACYNAEGVLVGITGKAHILSSLSTAVLFSGRSILAPYIVHELNRRSSSFDHMKDIVSESLESMTDALTELFGIDISPSAEDQPQGYRMFVAGWSDSNQRMECFNISSVEDADGLPAFTIRNAPGGLQTPGVSDDQCKLGFGGSPTVTSENIEDVAVTMVELQRQARFEDGRYAVGGLVELVTVRRDSITTKILKRWEEDKVGEMLKPSPVDWPAYRAAKATGGIPAGLSRLQRERMTKKAAKGTLRAA